MNILVLTCTTKNRKWLYDITNPTKEKYCKKYNYKYIFSNDFYPDKSKGVYWLKPAFIANNISNKYDWILWMDDDAGIINYNFNLEKFITDIYEPGKYIYGAKDLNGFNAGVLLVKSFNYSAKIFNYIYNKMEPYYKNSQYQDQDAILKISTDLNIIKFIDGHIINAYNKKLTISEPNQQNDFSAILHIAGGTEFKKQNLEIIKGLYNVYN